MLVMAMLLVLILYPQYTLTGPYRRDYEGKILDKSITLKESQYRAGARRRLHLEGRGGERFQVAVNEDIYERAQVGMWIRRSQSGVELRLPEPTPNLMGKDQR
ncbi:MAG: hypothetical protein ACR2G4_10010 [Pyrinomonadaceae bacterium]